MLSFDVATLPADCTVITTCSGSNERGCEGVRKAARFRGSGAVAIAKEMARSMPPNLAAVHLNDQDMAVLGARMISDLVAKTPTIKVLQLWGNDLGDRGAEAVADLAIASKGNAVGAPASGLESLTLEFNDIRLKGATAIANALGTEPSPVLRLLYLGANALGAVVRKYTRQIMRLLAEDVAGVQCTRYAIQRNWTQQQHIRILSLAAFRHQCTLLRVDIFVLLTSMMTICMQGAVAIADALVHNTRLTELDMGTLAMATLALYHGVASVGVYTYIAFICSDLYQIRSL